VNGKKDGRTDEYDEANSRFSQFCEKRLKTRCVAKSVADFLNFKPSNT
jgi:hypothetical protein